MSGEPDNRIDLDRLVLRAGEAAYLEFTLQPEAPRLGGQVLAFEDVSISTRIDVSRTSSGYALRLRADPSVLGTCARCLEGARLQLDLEAREVDQREGRDPDFVSPYVEDGLLDATAWLRDAIRLAIPAQLLCRSDCAGLCAVCGAPLNQFAPGEHSHETPRDPRFAKLRELEE